MKNIEQYTWEGFSGEISPDYDPLNDPLPQAIYRRHEICDAEFIMSNQHDLLADFIKGSQSSNLNESVGTSVENKTESVLGKERYLAAGSLVKSVNSDYSQQTAIENWRSVEIRLYDPFESFVYIDMDPEYAQEHYPTAYKLVQHYGDDCSLALYSYLAPNTVLHRHSDQENRDGEFVRIHIPLVIPDGDIFMEVNGEEIDWSDLFAFDNQNVHSVYNLSNEHRLIFMLDIRRTRLNLEPGLRWSIDRQLYQLSKPFVRQHKNTL